MVSTASIIMVIIGGLLGIIDNSSIAADDLWAGNLATRSTIRDDPLCICPI